MTAADYIKHLELLPHPEGGYYKEIYRSDKNIYTENGERSLCTSIYFLLERGQSSALHRIKSDEIWYHHDGGTLHIIELDESSTEASDLKEIITMLGKDLAKGEKLQHIVKAGRWFGARLPEETDFVLVGCQVSPGFDFRDFEMK